MYNIKILSTLFFAFGLSLCAFAQKGTIRGKIIEDETGEGLYGATAVIAGTSTGGAADFDGNYSINNVDAGTYKIQFSSISYQTKTVTDIVVKPGEVTVIDIRLSTDTQQLDEVVVTAEIIRDSETALATVQRKSVNLLDGISAQSFKRIGDSDAGSAIKRVPGVSLQGGKYVYIRGLGDRYTKSILNSVDIPGLDPDRNTVQIDIFPTNLINNIIVLKSFTPELSADFTGGIVNIETKGFPDEKTINVSASLGYNPSMHFNNNYLTYDGGGTDFLGFDDGTRDIPFPRNSTTRNPVVAGTELTELTQSLNKSLAAMRQQNGMDVSLGISAGNQINKENVTLGYNAALSYRNTTKYYEDVELGAWVKSEDNNQTGLVTNRIQKGSRGENNVLVSALLGGALKTASSKFKLNALHLQNGENRAADYVTQNVLFASNTLFFDNLDYSQRAITNILLSGDHFFDDGSWEVDWKISPTWSSINDKDVKQTPYRFEEGSFSIDPSEGGDPIRIWRFLDEVNYVGKADVVHKYDMKEQEGKFRFGLSETFKRRDFSIDNYRLNVRDPLGNFEFTGDPNELLRDENIWTPENDRGTFINNTFEANNTYEATQNVFGMYVSNEMPLGEKFKTIYGVRAEQFDHIYTGQDQTFFNTRGVAGESFNNKNLLSSFNLFPSLNLIYTLSENTNFKGHYTRTVARPSFKEKSITEIFDPLTDITFVGNIDLVETLINNFDFRWETFLPRAQRLSISVFYKDFTNPIEIVSFAQDPRSVQPQNVNSAQVYGIELEAKKSLGFISGSLEDLNLVVNASLIESVVKLSEQEFKGRTQFLKPGQTLDDSRQLQGQSPYLVNVGLNYGNDKGLETALFYNVQGEKLALVGINRNVDVFDHPFHSLNLNVNQRLGGMDGKMKIGVGINNILDDDQESFYKNFGSPQKVFSKLSPGRRFTLRFNYTF